MNFKLRATVLLTAILAITPTLSLAQPAQTGTLTGIVKDAQGGVLPGVSVTATSQERGFTRDAVTDAQGRYRFPSIAIGSYKITAKLGGFDAVSLGDNLVQTENTTNVSFTMKVGGLAEAVEVTGETPIVDLTNVSANTRVRREEFDKVPVGRSYQALMGSIPGVVGTGNVNSSGALTSNNLFLMDGIDTTDPTTGTFGGNLNFEAIEEISANTSAISAEYGRAIGAVVNVITKSGTNKFEGSAKFIVTNDNWDAQNKTKSETTGLSLARTKFDHKNPTWNVTLGGPIKKDRAWFFGTYENAKATSSARQTVGPIPENYQQTTTSAFINGRITAQINPKNMVWVKYFQSPTDGFIVDYWNGVSANVSALTSQNQTAKNWGGQWTSVINSSLTLEASFGTYASRIDVVPLKDGIGSNAPHFNNADGKNYNGATFDGYVERPRKQGNIAVTNFRTIGDKNHNFKAGLDFQRIESSSEFKFPTNSYYFDDAYNQTTGAFTPNSRRDYEAGPSISKGDILAFYLRDKFEVTKRLFLEAGIRLEKQKGTSDIGAGTIDSSIISPRLSGSFDVSGDGKTLIVASAGRFYTGVLQSFSDAFANVPQQSNYKNYLWNGTAYVFANEVRVGASAFKPNLNLQNPRTDELTLGFQRQIGRTMGVSVRVIGRKWADLLDDTRSFNPDLTINRQVTNYAPAQRKYKGVQFTFDKRFSNHWNTQVSYTYSKTEGNHFADNFSGLGDYITENCRTTIDTTIGANGTIGCAEVQEGANKYGAPTYDRPHNFKLNAAYTRKFGPVNLVGGMRSEAISKPTFTRNRTVNVLRPGSATVNAGPTATYFYEPLGANRIDGIGWFLDTNLEATWQIRGRRSIGLRTEVFNVNDRQEKLLVNNTAWCGTSATATCATAVSTFGTATARGSFRLPRNFRVQAIARF